jgi:hypothetical protein
MVPEGARGAYNCGMKGNTIALSRSLALGRRLRAEADAIMAAEGKTAAQRLVEEIAAERAGVEERIEEIREAKRSRIARRGRGRGKKKRPGAPGP